MQKENIQVSTHKLKTGQIEVVASFTANYATRIEPRDSEDFKEKAKEFVRQELIYEIWGRKNEDLRKWILENEDKLLSMTPMNYVTYEEYKKFFETLLEKVSGP